MIDPQDSVEIGSAAGRPASVKPAPTFRGPHPKFLAVWFRCCHVYGRMYRNKAETIYEGRCPKCGAAVSARIAPGGTNRRMFEAR